MSALAELGDKIAGLTLKEAVELATYMKDTHGIEPAKGGGGGGGGGGPVAPVAPPAEATEFNVVLEAGYDPTKKIGIIKVVRELTGQGLAEAKATVEGAPKNIKDAVDKKTAEDVKKKLEDAGAKVSVKPA